MNEVVQFWEALRMPTVKYCGNCKFYKTRQCYKFTRADICDGYSREVDAIKMAEIGQESEQFYEMWEWDGEHS